MTAITTQEQTRAALLESQRRVLERIASGAPLEEILETLVRLIEEQADDMRCAVLLADAEQKRLHFVAAPHLTDDYKQDIDPYLFIAPKMANCGTAAYLRHPVYTRDTATDPLWKGYSDIAVRAGLRAVWSTPIVSDDSRVLGTFAMFYKEPRLPSEEQIHLIDMATQMARVAIEATRDDDILRTVFHGAPGAMVITDLGGRIVRANHAFASMLGCTPAELQGKDIADISQADDDPVPVKELLSTQEEVLTERRYRTRTGAILWARERSALRRDSTGEPRYVLTHVDTTREAGSDPLQQLSRREREVLELVISGRTSKEIAIRLGIAASSVDTYRSRLMSKLSIEDLPGLVRFAIRHGIASL